jgi:hypothetical protein
MFKVVICSTFSNKYITFILISNPFCFKVDRQYSSSIKASDYIVIKRAIEY